MPEHLLHALSSAVGLLHSWQSVRTVERILIYKPDHLGDVLLATPALRAIRRRYPDATIRLVVGEWSDVVLAHNPNFDELAIYNSAMFVRPPYSAHNFRDLRRIVGDFKPDLIISLRDDWHTLVYPFAPATRRVNPGWVHVHEWIHRRRTQADRHHEIQRLWDMLRSIDIEPDACAELDYFMTNEERSRAAEAMGMAGIVEGFAAIHPGTSVPLKEWELNRFAEISRHLGRTYGMQIVLVGSIDEVDRSRELAALIPDLHPIDISGKLSLRITTALLEHAGYYLGSDGGAMHLAAIVGVPTIGLFGPGSYHIFHPVGPNAAGVSRHFPCSPCSMITCIRPHDTCMQAITVDEVLIESDRLLTTHRRTSAAESGATFTH